MGRKALGRARTFVQFVVIFFFAISVFHLAALPLNLA